eukprot:TRINITY_DN27165_c0_g1_i1.p1 TRINITY_DN27165_c0_g1~~TRINITY_DN27165_c0_g1_i1.p1  ORF type:complete len:1344 (+),score=179.91 TRINITY_DN27165_c0_g1_i1:34-4065(+)
MSMRPFSTSSVLVAGVAASSFPLEGIQVIDGGGGNFSRSTCITDSDQLHLNGTIIAAQCCTTTGACLSLLPSRCGPPGQYDEDRGKLLEERIRGPTNTVRYDLAVWRCERDGFKLCNRSCDDVAVTCGYEMFPLWTSIPCITTTTTTVTTPDVIRCFQQTSIEYAQAHGANHVGGVPRTIVPGMVYCPEECPYASICQAANRVQCVRAQDCDYFDKRRKPINKTADGGGSYCMNCRIVGCVSCDESNICSECQSGMVLSNGKCISDWRFWIIIMAICAFISLWQMIDLLVSCRRPNKNKRAVSEALRYRSHCHLRDHTRVGHPMYSYTQAPIHSQPVGGPGMPLFFNWFLFIAVVGIWLSVLAYIFGSSGWAPPDDFDNICIFLKNPRARDSFSDPRTVGLDFETHADLPKPFEDEPVLLWTALSYGGTLLLTIFFFVHQGQLWLRLVGHHGAQPILQHYAIEATGFPPDATDHAELKAWMKAVVVDLGLGKFGHDPVMEVSVSYLIDHVQHEVTNLVDLHLLNFNQKRASRALTSDLGGVFDVTAFDDDALSPEQMEKESAGTFWVQLLAFVLLGADMHCCCRRRIRGYTPTLAIPDPEESEDMLARLECSGSVIFVMSTVDIRNKLLEKCRTEVPRMFKHHHISRMRGTTTEKAPEGGAGKKDHDHHDHPSSPTHSLGLPAERVIQFRPVCEEPDGILWQNFGVPARTRTRRFVIAIFVILLTVFIWLVLFFFWARFSMWTVGDSATVATLGLMALSAATVIGNALLAQVIVTLMDYIGFKYKSSSQQIYLGLMVFFNCFMVILIEFALVCHQAILKLSSDLPVKFYYDYGMRLSMQELAGMLIPMYILLPYIGEPFITILVPYWVGILRVKADRRISRGHAERLLQAPEIDIVNTPYTDLICNATVFMLCFLAPSNVHKILMPALAFFAVFTYLMARKRILSWQTAVTIGTDDLHRLESYLWALPLGLLAANLGVHVAPVENSGDRIGDKSLLFGGIFFVGHVVSHFCFVRFVIPSMMRLSTKPPDETYEQAFRRHKGATYRCTNPIEVLKPSHVGGGSDQLVFYRVGKEHLQPNAHRTYKEADGAVYSLNSLIKEFAWDPEEHAAGGHEEADEPVPEIDILYDLLGFEDSCQGNELKTLEEELAEADHEHETAFPTVSRDPEEVKGTDLAPQQKSYFIIDDVELPEDRGQSKRVCKKCHRRFVDIRNFDWSCRVHLGSFEEGMWECCGKLGKDAPGCDRSKHEPDELYDADAGSPSLEANSSAAPEPSSSTAPALGSNLSKQDSGEAGDADVQRPALAPPDSSPTDADGSAAPDSSPTDADRSGAPEPSPPEGEKIIAI